MYIIRITEKKEQVKRTLFYGKIFIFYLYSAGILQKGIIDMTKTKVIWLKVVILLLACFTGYFIYSVYYAVSVSLRAERELQSVWFTCDLLREYVTKNRQWPGSWDDLEKYEYQGEPLLRPHHWPEECDTLKENVIVNFQIDLKTVSPESLKSLDLLNTRHEGYSFRESATYRELLNAIEQVRSNGEY